jgi:hypothetical protein
MIIRANSGTNFLPAKGSPKAGAHSPATSTALPEGCNQFLDTQMSCHLASSILSKLGGETDSAALAMACFEEVSKP